MAGSIFFKSIHGNNNHVINWLIQSNPLQYQQRNLADFILQLHGDEMEVGFLNNMKLHHIRLGPQ